MSRFVLQINEKARSSGLFLFRAIQFYPLVSGISVGTNIGTNETYQRMRPMDAPAPTRKARKKSTEVLNDAKIKAAKPKDKDWKLSDSGGLHLLIKTTGKKLWRLSYRFAGMQKTISMGAYPEVGLAEARQKREEARQKIKDNIDPSVDRKLTKLAQQVAAANTFDAIAEELMEKEIADGRRERTIERNRWLLSIASPFIGKRPITEIQVIELMQPLNQLKNQGKLETAHRLRVVMGMVFRFAVQTGRAAIDPTATLRGALPQPKVSERAAIVEPDEFAKMLRKIWNYHGEPTTRACLQLLALFFVRPSTLREARWSEFDLSARKWTIPAENDKTKRTWDKPISDYALSILLELQSITGRGELLFPQTKKKDQPISENTANVALRRIGITADQHCTHGFRSSATTLLNECGKFRPDIIEREIGHKDKNEIRDIYNRAVYWQERVELVDYWSNLIAFAVEPRIRLEPWP